MKRILKILISIAAILLICVVTLGWRSHLLLESTIQRIRDAGDPVNIAGLERKGIAPEENATTYLARIAQDARNLYTEIHPVAHADDFSWRTGLSESQQDQVRKSFDAYPHVLEMLKSASACNIHATSFDFNLPPSSFLDSTITHVQDSREFARVLDCFGRYLASSGKPDEAVATYLKLMRLADLQSQDPMIIYNLVTSACRGIGMDGLNGILQSAKVSPESHQAIEDELSKHHPLDNFVHAVKTERAFSIDMSRSQFSSALIAWYGGDYLAGFDSWIADGAKQEFELTNINPRKFSVMASLIEPALEAARESTNRSEAWIRCLRILNAIHAVVDKGETVDIKSLQLPFEVMIDPYSGRPLTIQSTPQGWIVYSVGRNKKDDGGSLKDLADIGVGPIEVMPN